MKKIVMIRRNGLGDFIAGMVPVCKYLETIYKDCEFYFFTSNANAELVQYFFPKAQVICISGGGGKNKYIQAISTALKYRWIKPDIGFSPLPDYPKLNNLFLYLIGAKERFARTTKNYLDQVTINKPYANYSLESLYQNKIGLCSLKIFDEKIDRLDKKFYPVIEQSLLKTYPAKFSGPRILVEVSNSKAKCQLSKYKTAKILNELLTTHKFSVLITAKKTDQDKAEQLKTLLNMDTEIYTTTDLNKLISFVNSSDVVLVGDGGLGHIAGALNKKIVALYGSTSIKVWGILTNEVTHLYDHDDVNNIPEQEILNALRVYL